MENVFAKQKPGFLKHVTYHLSVLIQDIKETSLLISPILFTM